LGNFWAMKLIVLFVHVFIVSCGIKETTDGEVVARVGEDKLTKENLLFLVGSQAGGVDVFSRAINKWVENRLLYHAAISTGLEKDLSLARERDIFYENLLVSSFIKIQTKEKTETTKKEVSDYYLKNKESFKRVDDEVVVKHFVFSKIESAKSFKKELKKKKSKKDMESLLNNQEVETKTIKKTSAGSNFVGFLFDGAIGDVLGPKKHNETFHVFQILQKHKKGSYLGLERVYDEIYQRLYKQKENFVLKSLIDSLYLNADVYVSQGALKQ
tara:strand:+ start:5322 stop:6134 length:813 start_codon:yes stop_codon:yes gene_type:complete